MRAEYCIQIEQSSTVAHRAMLAARSTTSATWSRTCHRDVARFAGRTGAGPFFAMEHIAFDEVTYRGEPAVYDHSSAFGRVGTDHRRADPGARRAARRPARRARRARRRRRARRAGWPTRSRTRSRGSRPRASTPFHAGRTGPASAVWFDGGELFGHPIEVLQRRDELLGLLRDGARRGGRDGTARSRCGS